MVSLLRWAESRHPRGEGQGLQYQAQNVQLLRTLTDCVSKVVAMSAASPVSMHHAVSLSMQRAVHAPRVVKAFNYAACMSSHPTPETWA